MTIDGLVEELRLTDSIRHGAEILSYIGAVIGMPKVGCAHDLSQPVGPVDENGDYVCKQWGWPDEVAAMWSERYLSFHTPFFDRCRYVHLPFSWSADHFIQNSAIKRQKQVASILKDYGYSQAIIVPVHLPKGRVAAVSFWGDRDYEDVQALVDTHSSWLVMASHYFLSLVGNQENQPSTRAITDTPSVREVECLALASKGLSDVEIAYQMDISIHTVRFHVNNVIRRLGARNRTHAVALAAQLGIIGVSTHFERISA